MHKKPKKYSIFSLIKNAFSYHENWQPAWRSPEPKKEYDAIIVGGGGHGLTTAYYLAKNHGITNIAVIERDGLVVETLGEIQLLLDQIIYGTKVLHCMNMHLSYGKGCLKN